MPTLVSIVRDDLSALALQCGLLMLSRLSRNLCLVSLFLDLTPKLRIETAIRISDGAGFVPMRESTLYGSQFLR